MTLLLLFLVAMSVQEQDARLKELLLRFQDDSIEVREKAGAHLVALGEAVLPALKEALSDESNVEVRGRIKGVVDRIESDQRRREFKGGKPVNGLGASLEGSLNPEATEFALKIRIMNLGAQPAELVLIDRWNSRFPNRSSASSGSEAAVVIRQLTGERGNRFGGSIGWGPTPRRTVVLLAPGESRTFERQVDVRELRSGDHEIEVEYFATSLLKDFGENLKTNTIPFKIER